MSNEQCRKAFEKHYRRLDLTRTYDGGYWKDEVRWRWEAWRAAQQALAADDAEALVAKLKAEISHVYSEDANDATRDAIAVVRRHFATPATKEEA